MLQDVITVLVRGRRFNIISLKSLLWSELLELWTTQYWQRSPARNSSAKISWNLAPRSLIQGFHCWSAHLALTRTHLDRALTVQVVPDIEQIAWHGELVCIRSVIRSGYWINSPIRIVSSESTSVQITTHLYETPVGERLDGNVSWRDCNLEVKWSS